MTYYTYTYIYSIYCICESVFGERVLTARAETQQQHNKAKQKHVHYNYTLHSEQTHLDF